MNKKKKLTVSFPPFLHNGSSFTEKNYDIFVAAIPALVFGLIYYGVPALGVVSLSISSAIIWHFIFEKLLKKDITIGDGSSALIGLLIGMMLPAASPWWLVLVSTFVAIIIGVQIFGGAGNNPFNPVALSIAILSVSWENYFDLNQSLANFKLNFSFSFDPLSFIKYFGPETIENIEILDLLIGHHISTIGSGCSVALILGGSYLIIRNTIRWEISLSYLLSVILIAFVFHIYNPLKFASPVFHLLTGSTMIGIFFLATEDSSSPVNFLPMILFGFIAGLMTVLIRNIGLYTDGVVFAILLANLVSPILDKIKTQKFSNKKAV